MSCRIYIDRFSYADTERGQKKITESKNGLSVLRRAVEDVYGIDPETLTIEHGVHGKPYFKERGDIFFNISHSGDFAAAAVCGYPVGVDIQVFRPVKNSLINKLCSAEEKSYINSSSDKSRAFIELWTLKESYIKATGDGMSFPMDKVCFDIRGRSLQSGAVGRFSTTSGLYYIKSCREYSLAACVLI